MGENSKGINWSVLWKSDDWMSVWIGFFILIFFLAGATMSLPGWKWIGDGSFQDKIAGYAKKVDSVAKDAEAKGETALKDQAAALKTALDAKDRKAIGDAAGKMEAAAKEVKDKDFQKKSAKVAADIKGDAGATVSKVFSGGQPHEGALSVHRVCDPRHHRHGLHGHAGRQVHGRVSHHLHPLGLAYFVSENDIVKYYGLEVVFWALIFGLLISNIFGVPEWLKSAIKTEFFIKIGLVLLGAEVLFGTIAKVGAYGMVQSVLVIGVVFYFCLWVARKVGT